MSATAAVATFVLGLGLVIGVGALGGHDTSGDALPKPSLPAIAAATEPTPSVSATAARPKPSPVATVPPPSSAAMSGPAVAVIQPATFLSESGGLSATGIRTMAPAGPYLRMVRGTTGAIWALSPGGLSRYDPTTGRATTWSVDDDARFTARDIAAGRDGSVWLIAGSVLRRFDGTRFDSAVDMGYEIEAIASGRWDDVWVATAQGMLFDLAGTTVRVVDALKPDRYSIVTALAVDEAGSVWCGWSRWDENSSSGWVARWNGEAWTAFTAANARPLGGAVRSVVPLADGSVWVGTDLGMATFVGTRWSESSPGGTTFGIGASSFMLDRDGTLWAAAASGYDASVGVGHLVAGKWTSYGTMDGLPSMGSYATLVTQVDGRVVVGAGSGLFAFDGARWSMVWPRLDAMTYPLALVAVSGSAAWAADPDSVWHGLGTSWHRESPEDGASDYAQYPRDIVRAGDGSIWVLRGETAWALDNRGWLSVTRRAGAIAVGPDGLVRVTLSAADSTAWSVRTFVRSTKGWRERAQTSVTDGIAWPQKLGVGRDGTIWVGSWGAWAARPGLVRLVSGRWQEMWPRGRGVAVSIGDIDVATNGDVWVLGNDALGWDEANRTYTDIGPSWVGRFSGGRWIVYQPGVELPLDGVHSLAAAPDGSVWAAGDGGVARWSYGRWASRFRGVSFTALSIAPDGAVWAIAASGVVRLPPW